MTLLEGRAMTRYGVQRTDPDRLTWWGGGNRWVIKPVAARWFHSESEAELAALRDLPDPRTDWRVVPIFRATSIWEHEP